MTLKRPLKLNFIIPNYNVWSRNLGQSMSHKSQNHTDLRNGWGWNGPLEIIIC